MTEQASTTDVHGETPVEPGAAPYGGDHAATVQVDERPELVVAKAFAGGLAVALILKRLAR